MIGALITFTLAAGPLIIAFGAGVVCSESTRRVVRKFTKGRFFGPVPADRGWKPEDNQRG